jgi:nitrate reductase beta subunit
VPESFNRQLFGPGAARAVELYKRAYEDPRLIGLLMLFGGTDKIISSFKVQGDIVTGSCAAYNQRGDEILRVPMKEPIIIRKRYDEKRDVHRISVT